MKPIVSPILIYLLGIIPTIRAFLFAVGGVGLTISAIIAFFGVDDLTDTDDIKALLAKVKKYITGFIIAIFIGLLIPSQDTLTAMVVSSYVTPDNIEILGDTAKDTVDYIFEKIDDAKESKND